MNILAWASIKTIDFDWRQYVGQQVHSCVDKEEKTIQIEMDQRNNVVNAANWLVLHQF